MKIKPGMKFGKLTAVARSGVSPHKKALWKCRCDCGKIVNYVVAGNLVSGGSKSCGCIGVLKTIKRNIASSKHGMGGTPEYDVWYGMMSRCNDRMDSVYHNYGGRGIKVCEFISSHPANLYKIVGPRPRFERKRHYSLDRIDNNGHYSCGKCNECRSNNWNMNLRWITQKEQCRNTRHNRLITIEGETRCVSEWADIFNINAHTLRGRIEAHWSSEKLSKKP